MKRILVNIIFFVILINFSFLLIYSHENIAIGMKNGDWIEYNVICTGDIPLDHNISWAKIEVTDVQNELIFVNITSRYSDSRNESITSILNIQTGQLGEGFIIPANLGLGDKIFEQINGMITIDKVEKKTIANKKRTVIGADTANTSFYWDQKTGFLVEANTTNTSFGIISQANKTNIWQNNTFEMDFIISISLVLVSIALVSIIIFRYKLKKIGFSPS
ncbi:MAG: hypothetical protein P8X91_05335 [Candidatus Bathyarchaeota archaeon]|jgi:hypothetical protein